MAVTSTTTRIYVLVLSFKLALRHVCCDINHVYNVCPKCYLYMWLPCMDDSIRPAICVVCAWRKTPTLPVTPAQLMRQLVLAKTRPAHWVIVLHLGQAVRSLGSCGSLISSCFSGPCNHRMRVVKKYFCKYLCEQVDFGSARVGRMHICMHS